MSKTFFISDLHFDHENIIRLCSRPFIIGFDEVKNKSIVDVEAMNEKIIADWNAVVSPEDIVWNLGDFSWNKKDPEKYFDRLNGTKHFILGNHDPQQTRQLEWKSIQYYREIDLDNEFLVLFHYPISDHNRRYRGSIHLHGHVHSSLANPFNNGDNKTSFDVGIDNLYSIFGSYSPVTLDQIKKYLNDRNNK